MKQATLIYIPRWLVKVVRTKEVITVQSDGLKFRKGPKPRGMVPIKLLFPKLIAFNRANETVLAVGTMKVIILKAQLNEKREVA